MVCYVAFYGKEDSQISWKNDVFSDIIVPVYLHPVISVSMKATYRIMDVPIYAKN